MTFDRFMELALYEPGLGYYATLPGDAAGRPSALADFQTSPQVHPGFGYLVARQLHQFWEALGRPEPFVVVELGAGAGELAAQIMEGLAELVEAPRIEYHAVDSRGGARPTAQAAPSAESAGQAAARSLASAAVTLLADPMLTWWPSLADLRRAGVRAHCVLSNEFFDALPVHRVAWIGGVLRELYVDWSGRGFVERVGDPSDEALSQWIEERGAARPEGWRGEVCLRLEPVLAAVSGLIDRGSVLTLDYGSTTADGDAAERADGTLLAYHRHQWSDDIFRRVGQQDLTSHVDFGAMVRLGRRVGLEPVFLTTQRDFLLRLGLADETERWISREATAGRRWQARWALAELIRSAGLGRLKVLVQQRV